MAKSKQKQAASRVAATNTGSSGGKIEEYGFPPSLLKNISSFSSEVEPLIPNAMFVMRHALSSAECQAWIAYAEENNGSRWDVVCHPATKYIAHRE
jgi:hypothetical protein